MKLRFYRENSDYRYQLNRLKLNAALDNMPPPEDKEMVISQMCAVYANANCTIIAADGSDAEAGLRRLSNTSGFTTTTLVGQNGSISLSERHCARNDHYSTLDCSKWSTRAWTL